MKAESVNYHLILLLNSFQVEPILLFQMGGPQLEAPALITLPDWV